jgi:hypothetical protein
VQPQFGGQHRTSRPAPGDDHIEHEGRAIGGDAYVNRPTVMVRGSTHIDIASMGLTSSGGVTVNSKLQAGASSRPIVSQPRDHDPNGARAVAGRIRRIDPGPLG